MARGTRSGARRTRGAARSAPAASSAAWVRPTTSLVDAARGEQDRLREADAREAPVRHDAEPAQAEQVGAARRPRGRSRRGGRAAPGAAAAPPSLRRAASDVAASRTAREHRLRDALDELQRDVAGEAVGDDDVGGAVGDVGALDVADEVERGRPRRARRSSAWASSDERRALGRLLAVGEQRRRAGARRRARRCASAAPMKANWTRCSGRTSALAPTSSSVTGCAGDRQRDARARGGGCRGARLMLNSAGGERGAGGAAADERVGLARRRRPRGLDDRGVGRRARGARGVGRLGDRDGRVDDLDAVGPTVADLVGRAEEQHADALRARRSRRPRRPRRGRGRRRWRRPRRVDRVIGRWR